MTTFDKREQAHENRYAHDAERLFRARARRNALLGRWLADILGRSGDAKTLADRLAALAVADPDDGGLVQALRSEIDAAGIEVSDHRLHKQIDRLAAEALASLDREQPRGA